MRFKELWWAGCGPYSKPHTIYANNFLRCFNLVQPSHAYTVKYSSSYCEEEEGLSSGKTGLERSVLIWVSRCGQEQAECL